MVMRPLSLLLFGAMAVACKPASPTTTPETETPPPPPTDEPAEPPPSDVDTPPPGEGGPGEGGPGAGQGKLGDACSAESRCGPELGCSGLFREATGTCVAEAEASQACKTQGGEWGKWGMMGGVYCMKVLDDAGKACRDNDECKGHCIADEKSKGKGTCQRLETQFGCYSTLEDGKPGAALCVD